MARINTYSIDSDITGDDKWIGTDVSQNNATKNFTAADVAAFVNSSGAIDAQTLRYTYQNVTFGVTREPNTLSFLTELGNSVPFSSITNWVLSRYSKQGNNDVGGFYTAPLIGSTVLITKIDDPGYWGIYHWNSSTIVPLEPEFYDIGLTFIAGNGDLFNGQDYLISLLTYAAGVYTSSLDQVLTAGDTTGPNNIYFDGNSSAIFNTTLELWSETGSGISYISADMLNIVANTSVTINAIDDININSDTLDISTASDIVINSNTWMKFDLINSSKLIISSAGVSSVADLWVNAGLYDQYDNGGNDEDVLISYSGGTKWESVANITGNVTGVGIINYIPKWLNATSEVVDSLISDNGTSVTVEGRIAQTNLGESTFFGDRAGENDDLTNRQNTSFGCNALQANILGTSNTAIGYSALLNNIQESNTAIGFASLTTNTIGIYNTGVGIYSLRDNLSGIYNTAFGTNSLISNTSGNYNISVGVDSLGDNTIGDYNISMGRNSGRYITDGSTSNTEPLNSIFIGNSTKALGDSQENQIVIGDSVTGAGSNTTSIGNTSNNNYVLNGLVYQESIGDSTYFGSSAGMSDDFTARQNTGVGNLALLSTDVGESNVAVGYVSLFNNTSGSNHTAVGYASLSAMDIDERATAVGSFAFSNAEAAYNGVAIGSSAGTFDSLGADVVNANYSVFIGGSSGPSAEGNNNEIVIGAYAKGNGSNTATIGDTDVIELHLVKPGASIALRSPNGTVYKISVSDAGALVIV